MFRPPSEDQSLGPRFSRRALLVGAMQVGLFGLLANRLYDLQVAQSRRLALLAENNRINLRPLLPTRGRILDAKGRILAYNEETFGLAIVPDTAGDVAQVLDRLGEIVEVPPGERKRVLALAARQSRILPISLEITLAWEQLARVNVLAPQLPGIETEVRHARTYREGDAMGHLVGFIGAVERFEIDGDRAMELAAMRVGKQGVEHGCDERLRGRGGIVRREVDARGRIVREMERKQPEAGGDVRLTVDSALQRKVLARVAREGVASLVALEITSGRLVAMASAPSFDNGVMNGGIGRTQWEQLEEAPGKPLIDKTIRGQYPPGSTFKMVTALAALEAGVVARSERIACRGSHTLADHTFRCWNSGGHGPVDLHRALRESCNVYFYQLAERLGIERLAEMAVRLGLGHTIDFELRQQKEGVVPTPGWKIANLGRPWLGGETLLAGIGQGYVLATPLQLAVMTARIASGRAVNPRLVDGEGTAHAPGALGIDPANLAAVQRGMWAVVNEGGGTALVAGLGLAGVAMAGKTGTAQVKSIRRHGKVVERAPHSVFVGYAPAAAPRYAVAAIVEHGGGGSARAAPMARDVMLQLFAHEAEVEGAGEAAAAPGSVAGVVR